MFSPHITYLGYIIISPKSLAIFHSNQGETQADITETSGRKYLSEGAFTLDILWLRIKPADSQAAFSAVPAKSVILVSLLYKMQNCSTNSR